jgi:hypothetical protein
MEYEEQDLFKVEDGDWLVVLMAKEEEGTYQVAEKRGDEVVYYASPDLEEMVEKGEVKELDQKMNDDSFHAVRNNSGSVPISKITSMSSLDTEEDFYPRG